MKYDLKPCPLCNGRGPLMAPENRKKDKGWLYHGHASSDSMGVICYRCGLQLVLRVPDKWPRNTPKKLKGMKAIDWLHEQVLLQAVGRWNSLPRKEKCSTSRRKSTAAAPGTE